MPAAIDEVVISWRYDPSIVYAFSSRPEREDDTEGHWHYEYGDGVTFSVYHDAKAYPDC